jgi:hypothetical protein
MSRYQHGVVFVGALMVVAGGSYGDFQGFYGLKHEEGK